MCSTDANNVNSSSTDLFRESCSCPLHGPRFFQNLAHCSTFFAQRTFVVVRILHGNPVSYKLRFESFNVTSCADSKDSPEFEQYGNEWIVKHCLTREFEPNKQNSSPRGYATIQNQLKRKKCCIPVPLTERDKK